MEKDLFDLTPGRSRRRRRPAGPYLAAGLLAAAAAVIFFGARAGKPAGEAGAPAAVESSAAPETTLSAEEIAAAEHEAAVDAVIADYKDLGLVRVSGYLNVHSEGAQNSDIIGKLYDGSACEILDTTEDGWIHMTSGGIEGYVHSDYVKTGDEARSLARQEVKERAVVGTEKLNVRSTPGTDGELVGTVLKNERYVVQETQDNWIRINQGWISGDYCDVRLCMNEARKLDLRQMVLNLYDNIGVAVVENYLNIHEKPGKDEKIIGKMTARSGCDILETADGWLKVRSGPVTGYVSADYIATGQQAKDLAVENAQLMAIVTTDVLNARSEPTEASSIWTQITNQERYPVLEQQDGWVKIELEEEDNAFVKSEFVDVRYTLTEAVKFSPAEEAAMQSASRRQQIVNYALQFLGNRYVWGGTSLTKGCDCSGFTMSVMAHFGVGLPHYSGSQAQMGKKVTSSEMRPGDLIFYSNSRGVINHVSMYIGNGQIVHAASRRSGIKISTWNYRAPRAIRNVLGD